MGFHKQDIAQQMDRRDGHQGPGKEAEICKLGVVVVVVVFPRQDICGFLGWKMDQRPYCVFMKVSGKVR